MSGDEKVDELLHRPWPHETPERRDGSHFYPRSPLGEREEGIATGRDVEWEPLIDYRRHGVSETTIHGAVAWASDEEIFHSFGGNVLCYGRSMMKPVMLKVFAEILEPETTWEQKAIAVASHNGSAEHVRAAQSLLPEPEWGLMQTPLDVPLVQFGRQVRRPRRWYNNSSGQHAAILKGCRLRGFNRAGYTLPHHEWFAEYLELIRRDLGAQWQPRRMARDGDGFPTIAMTVGELAKIYAGLALRRDEDWIFEAMVRHPDLVGGFNRLDSTILKACDGKVIAKEGADGLLGMAIDHPDHPQGLGVVVKIAHGWNPRATWYIARGILGTLGFELRNPYKLYKQKAFLVPGVVPPDRLEALESIPTWDDWDPDRDHWSYEWSRYATDGPISEDPA